VLEAFALLEVRGWLVAPLGRDPADVKVRIEDLDRRFDVGDLFGQALALALVRLDQTAQLGMEPLQSAQRE
jgi:hypothetical protein